MLNDEAIREKLGGEVVDSGIPIEYNDVYKPEKLQVYRHNPEEGRLSSCTGW